MPPDQTPSPTPQPTPDPAPDGGVAGDRAGERPLRHTGFAHHARTFAGLTLVSRVLGLVRDALLARLLGVSAIGTAFAIAFQFPNTFRRLFGEGALSAAFIPEYAGLVERDPALADRFASLTVGAMSVGLGLLVLVIELVLGATLALSTLDDDGRRALLYLAIMLPYAPLVCVTAVLGGMLQTRGRFAAQAGAPIILNLCMIAAAWTWGHAVGAPADGIALAVSAGVTLAGVLQVLWCLHDLRGLVRWRRTVTGAGAALRRMLGRMGPVVVGLGTVQLGTLIESWVLVGWPLTFGATIAGRPYPLDEGAGAALYSAQRLYQFPLGVFGIAVATAVFPLLARQRDDPEAFVATLRRGVRMSLLIGVPATAGLMLVARDLCAVIYLGGKITPDDVARMSRALLMYGPLVGAYSLTHVLTRAFYARGDTVRPTIISIAAVVVGLALSAGLMFVMSEAGLALGASIAAVAQVAALAWLAHGRLARAQGPSAAAGARDGGGLFDRGTLGSIARILAMTLVMVAGLLGLDRLWPAGTSAAWSDHLLRLAVFCGAGAGIYGLGARLVLRREVSWMLERPGRGSSIRRPSADEPDRGTS